MEIRISIKIRFKRFVDLSFMFWCCGLIQMCYLTCSIKSRFSRHMFWSILSWHISFWLRYRQLRRYQTLFLGVLELPFCTDNLMVKFVSGIINEIYDLVWANRALCEFFKHASTNYCPGFSCEHCCVGRTDNHFACLDVSHWDQGISSRLGAWLPCCSLNNHVVTKSWAPETSDPRRQICVILTSDRKPNL